MTGLLHRLAQRATGNAWTVRSDVRLPFGADGLDRPQDDTAPPLMEAAVPETHAPARPRPPEPASLVTAAQEQAVPPLVQSPAVAAQSGRAQPVEAEAAATRTPVATTTPAQPPGAPGTPGTAAVPATAMPAMASLHTPARPQSKPPPRREEPAPLLPSQPSTAGHVAPLAQTVRGPAAFALRPAPQAAASQETEVHIHIGRIDVTALHEAPRPKARPRERTQPVSLDAYLAARSKT
ncbi:hypothetical protein SAMN05444679_103238 [Variovorax sp. CF079]|uniref:hypothetical protein n=1 Tax=Variovorax sp. CF079 TaxID=1882774 RepID=UPI000881781D|nr:hypothetical protein [Variovorax sp. CF079]SDC50674.1 hypothetical protein SAMN05444679_103238 [Variovorax sp. CF079]